MLRSTSGTRKECRVPVRPQIWCFPWSRNITIVLRKCKVEMHNLNQIKISGSLFTLMTPMKTPRSLKTSLKLLKQTNITTTMASSLNTPTPVTSTPVNSKATIITSIKDNTAVQKWQRAKQTSLKHEISKSTKPLTTELDIKITWKEGINLRANQTKWFLRTIITNKC